MEAELATVEEPAISRYAAALITTESGVARACRRAAMFGGDTDGPYGVRAVVRGEAARDDEAGVDADRTWSSMP